MIQQIVSAINHAVTRVLLAASLATIAASASFAQIRPDAPPPSPSASGASKDAANKGDDRKAEEIVQRAVEALGGRAYLDVHTVVSRGYYTGFRDGVAALPYTFNDNLVLPDRARTEFRGQGARGIETHDGDKGWLLDATTRKILDLTPEQVKDFRLTLRASLDNLLRGWWRKEGAQLTYAGRREAGVGLRNEAVRLTYADGFTVEFEFGARDHLPAKALYKKQNKEGEDVEEEDRYAQFLTIGGVLTPFVVDHYRAGVQSSRANYQTIEFNKPVPDSLFARPLDAKSLK
ncbi:MAG: hypothetical protein WCD76_11945 [Pyrinomonadaceae bacterium]